MERVTVSSTGQIEIPKQVREELGLIEGSKLKLEVCEGKIVLSECADWWKLEGAGKDLILDYAAFKEKEKELEDKHF